MKPDLIDKIAWGAMTAMFVVLALTLASACAAVSLVLLPLPPLPSPRLQAGEALALQAGDVVVPGDAGHQVKISLQATKEIAAQAEARVTARTTSMAVMAPQAILSMRSGFIV